MKKIEHPKVKNRVGDNVEKIFVKHISWYDPYCSPSFTKQTLLFDPRLSKETRKQSILQRSIFVMAVNKQAFWSFTL